MAQTDEWSSNANDSIQISLVQQGPDRPKSLSRSFRPQFTYPIFGDEERIFGYQGLIIRIRFAAHDLRPNVHISYDKKFPQVGDTVALDLLKTLKQWMPESAFGKTSDFEKSIQDDDSAKTWMPPGKLVKSYPSKGKHYQIWCGPLANPAVREIIERMQIFISFFIEGGRPITTDNEDWTIDRWNVYLVYEKLDTPPTPNASAYSIVGYSTTYRFYCFTRASTSRPKAGFGFPPKTPIPPSELPSRLRISQFLILPPHQSSGHGTHLYDTIYEAAIPDPTVVELTVEDPNEAFDVLRDANDWTLLRPLFTAQKININSSPFAANQKRPKRLPTALLIPVDKLTTLRTTYKIAPRQFARLLEMHLLSLIPAKHRAAGGVNVTRLLIQKSRAPDENDRRYYWWRMLVKQRVYKKQRDILIQLDRSERIEKLEEVVGSVEGEYEQLLRFFEERENKSKERAANGLGKKRRLVIEDDDDEDEAIGGAGDGENPKRVKS